MSTTQDPSYGPDGLTDLEREGKEYAEGYATNRGDATAAALEELGERRRDGIAYLVRKAAGAFNLEAFRADAARIDAEAAAEAEERRTRPLELRVRLALERAIGDVELAVRQEHSYEPATSAAGIVADLTAAYRGLLEAKRLELETAPPIAVEPADLSFPATPDEVDALRAARDLLTAIEDAGIQREHFNGRLEAMLRPLERLEVLLGDHRTGA